LRRPLTMTRWPLVSDSATFSACWRQTLIRKNEVSPSFQVSPSRTREVTATRKLATACPLGVNRSSGSPVRLPAMVTKVSMAPSLGSVCLRAQAAWSGGLAGKGSGQRCDRNQPRSAACRRFLAGRNVGGAQGGVLHACLRRSRPAGRRPGVPLAGQRDHATVGSPTSTPSPEEWRPSPAGRLRRAAGQLRNVATAVSRPRQGRPLKRPGRSAGCLAADRLGVAL
jgi:hypothetical protein